MDTPGATVPAADPSASRLAVLGDAAAADLAAEAAAVFSRRARLPVTVLATWSGPGRDGAGSATRGARDIAAAVTAATGVEAVARGRTVRVALPADPAAAATAYAAIVPVAAGRAALGLAVCGARTAALDTVLAAQSLLVLVSPPDAPPGLVDATRASLATAAPGVVVAVIARPAPGLPRPLRHRAALRDIAAALAAPVPRPAPAWPASAGPVSAASVCARPGSAPPALAASASSVSAARVPAGTASAAPGSAGPASAAPECLGPQSAPPAFPTSAPSALAASAPSALAASAPPALAASASPPSASSASASAPPACAAPAPAPPPSAGPASTPPASATPPGRMPAPAPPPSAAPASTPPASATPPGRMPAPAPYVLEVVHVAA